MTPRRAGLIGTALVFSGFLAVSQVLGVLPGRPIAMRTDIFFQSDAGGLIQDAVLDRSFRARGTHPLVYPLWTKPLFELIRILSPTIDPQQTAVWYSRLLIASVAGIGFGCLAAVLAQRGIRGVRLMSFLLLTVAANGHAIAAIPDHFGLSAGLIAATLAVFLSTLDVRRKLVLLAILGVPVFGITITNIVLPAGLFLALAIPRYGRHWSRRTWLLLGLGTILLGIGAVALVRGTPAMRQRIGERVEMYLNYRLTDDPLRAVQFTARGLINAVTAPTPVVTTKTPLGQPMITYEPPGEPRSFWPYDAIQSAGVAAWLVLLSAGIASTLHDPSLRTVGLAIVVWILFNAALHNLWGDEYFLYSSHYVGPLLLLASLGRLPTWFVTVATLFILTSAVRTLLIYRQLLDGIAA